jgi:hypothetical protein
MSDLKRTSELWWAHLDNYPPGKIVTFCFDCLCPEMRFGTCHCDHDIYGPDCFKRGRHEDPNQPSEGRAGRRQRWDS